ncbi:MAG: prepilin-type N-terminal cleavage/methylation domain-containing protein [Acidimicrobiia bacterium]|nr:prepilin-type N-terminal cleavage/methylation domain-containing protein [Acidimicrobiia bacterium]
MRGRRNRRGVTLLELLIAVTLVSLLAVGMLLAMRIGLDAMQKTNQRFAANRRVLGAQKALYQQLAGMMPVAIRCGGPPVLFMQGTPVSMQFVSSYSLEEAARGTPRLLEYAVIPGEAGQGVRLVARETLYTGPSALGRYCGPAPPLGRPGLEPGWFVLADRLASCRMSYQVRDPETGATGWVPLFRSTIAPIAVRFEMRPLQADLAQLQMASMTVPLRLTRQFREKYADMDDPPIPR